LTTTTTTLPAPTPTPCAYPREWQPAPLRPEQYKQAVRDAQASLPDRCGYALLDEEPQHESLRMLAGELRRRGYCAVQHEDRVLILRDDGLWEEHHGVAFTDGCWFSNSFKGVLEAIP